MAAGGERSYRATRTPSVSIVETKRPKIIDELRDYGALLLRLAPMVLLSLLTACAHFAIEWGLERWWANDPRSQVALLNVVQLLFFAMFGLTIHAAAGLPYPLLLTGLPFVLLAPLGNTARIFLLPELAQTPAMHLFLFSLQYSSIFAVTKLVMFWKVPMRPCFRAEVVWAFVSGNFLSGFVVSMYLLWASSERAPSVDILVSGLIYPFFTSAFNRVFCADYLSFLYTLYDDSRHVRRVTIKIITIMTRMILHSTGIMVLLRMTHLGTFVSSLVLSTVAEVLATAVLAYRAAGPSHVQPWTVGMSTVLSSRTADSQTESQGAPTLGAKGQPRTLVAAWLRYRAKECPRKRLVRLVVAEECAERVNVISLGCAAVFYTGLRQQPVTNSIIKCVSLILGEMVEDMLKKRALWYFCNTRAGSSDAPTERSVRASLVIGVIFGPSIWTVISALNRQFPP